jgi:hypothetical protein
MRKTVAIVTAIITAGFGALTAGCPPGSHYPRQTTIVMHPLPGTESSASGRPALENPASANLAGMANPCKGVPTNPWCPA